MRAILLATMLATLMAHSAPAREGGTAMSQPQLQSLWTNVITAQTEEDQLAAIQTFMSALPRAGGLPADYALTARDRQGNSVDFSEPRLMGNPGEHIVTLHTEGQTFDYIPLCSRCLSILLQE